MTLLAEMHDIIGNAELAFTLHAQQRITVRRIKVSAVREAIVSPNAEVIEDYPNDPRGPSCLLYGETSDRVLHVHLSYPPEIVVITTYEPDLEKWQMGLKARK